MTASRHQNPQGPVRLGWGLGLLTLCAVVFASTFLPAVAVVLLGAGSGVGGAAMLGGFAAGLFAYIGVIRLGVRRGWWA
jgi:hypothetical protein